MGALPHIHHFPYYISYVFCTCMELDTRDINSHTRPGPSIKFSPRLTHSQFFFFYPVWLMGGVLFVKPFCFDCNFTSRIFLIVKDEYICTCGCVLVCVRVCLCVDFGWVSE